MREASDRERARTRCSREAGWPDAGRNVLVVGHQPTLGEVAARLLGASGGLAVRKGAIWWFAARSRHEVVLKAVLDPDLAEERG